MRLKAPAIMLGFLGVLLASAGHCATQTMTYPEAPVPSADTLITPPGEATKFPLREDGQAYRLQLDMNSNYTDYLNRRHYELRWDGMVWAPYNMGEMPEKIVRTLETWPEYSEFSTLRVFNGWHTFWEVYSGFGP